MSCSVADCPKDPSSNGMCSMHYARVLRHGSPHIAKTNMEHRPPPGLSEMERFWHRVEKQADGCWIWKGHLTRGYGRFRFDDDTTQPAHRAAWILLVGPIPDANHIDHLCWNRPCVNPDHLEPVTPQENMRRVAERNHDEWTTCQSGRHPYPENRVLEPSTGRYRCLMCRREAQRRYKAKMRDAD